MTFTDGPAPSELELGRRAFRRQQTVRSVLIGAASTLVVAGLLWFGLTSAPGWPKVQQTFLNPAQALASLPDVATGFLLNLQVLGVAVVCVFVLGMLLAAARTLRGPVFFPLRAIAAGYTDLFRGMPLIIVLYLVGLGIPGLRFTETRIPAVVFGTIAIVLVYSAYVSEVLRAGIEAVHPSQRLAARALGLSHAQSLRLVVIPQGLRKVTPALMNDFVAMQKDVGLISVLGAVDAVRAAQIDVGQTYNFTPYVVAALLFVLLAIPTIRVTDWYSARLRRREQMGSLI